MSWQTQGNILLGLTWLISGIAVYCLLIGAAGVFMLAVADRLRTPDNATHRDGNSAALQLHSRR